MRKGIPLAVAVIFMAVIGLQMVGPTAAAKLVDKGTVQKQDYAITWKTTQYNKNSLRIRGSLLYKGVSYKSSVALKKTRTKLKINGTTVTTTLTAAQYYWRVLRPQIFS